MYRETEEFKDAPCKPEIHTCNVDCPQYVRNPEIHIVDSKPSSNSLLVAQKLRELDAVMGPEPKRGRNGALKFFPIMAAASLMPDISLDITTFSTRQLNNELECREREGKVYYKDLKHVNIEDLRMELDYRKMK